MNIYYVYAYLRSKDSQTAKAGTPYYIGKGSGDRAWKKGKGEIYPPVDKNNIIIIETNLTDIGALAIERQMIRWYGRIDLTTGTLRNKSDGGDGAAGAKRTIETKLLMSNAQKGIPRTSTRIRAVKSPNGTIYRTLAEAAIAVGITSPGIQYRCSVNKDGWCYV